MALGGGKVVRGGGEDLGLNKVNFSRPPPFECYLTEGTPPNNI